MNRIGKVALGVALLATVAACSRVPQGHVGIKVHTLGNNRGPDLELLEMGRYWIAPGTQELHLLPTRTNNYVWTASATEGSPENEEITFQDEQGLAIQTDIGVELRLDPEHAVFLFERYRRGLDEIIDGPVRNYVRSSFVAHASTMQIEDIHGARRTELLESVFNDVREEFAPYGIIIEQIYWVGEMRIPREVRNAITARVQATQDAIRAENQLRQTEAQAAMDIAQAQGEAQARIAAAEGEAAAIELRGAALRANPEVLQQDAIQRWDGVLPRVMMGEGDTTPFIQIPTQ